MIKTFTYPNATVHVTIPDRTAAEEAAWEKRIKKATEEFLRAVIKAKEGQKCTANTTR